MMMCAWLAHCWGMTAGSGVTGKGLGFRETGGFFIMVFARIIYSCGLIVRSLGKLDEILNFRAIMGFSCMNHTLMRSNCWTSLWTRWRVEFQSDPRLLIMMYAWITYCDGLIVENVKIYVELNFRVTVGLWSLCMHEFMPMDHYKRGNATGEKLAVCHWV